MPAPCLNIMIQASYDCKTLDIYSDTDTKDILKGAHC